jgi:fibronectin type 3 domain-containing protein
LVWDAPTSSTDPVVGYNIYRSPSDSDPYKLLNSLPEGQTFYVDNTVQSGMSYIYIVESVDASNVKSAPSGTIAVTIP